MTNFANERRILASISANPDAPNWRIAKNLGLKVSEVSAVRGIRQPAAATKPAAEVTGGIDLKGLKVLPRKPADSAAGYIKRLPAGLGFEPRVLAAEWGISEETIRRHAKDLKCLKFVEVNDEWTPMVMHPETAARYHA